MANFFELLGLNSDELADSNPELIVQTFHTDGKDGVRKLMYGLVADRLARPIHIHPDHMGNAAEVYGQEQAGPAIALIRDKKDLYRRSNDTFTSSQPMQQLQLPGANGTSSRPPSGAAGAAGGASRASASKKSAGNAAAVEMWEKRFADLKDFVDKHGYRPRRSAQDISEYERRLHYWMGQNQRKLNKGELDGDRAERLKSVLRVKGKGATSQKGRREGGAGGGEHMEEDEEEEEQYLDNYDGDGVDQ